MKTLSTADLKALIDQPAGTCVSMYLPMHRSGDLQQDPIRLKNALQKTEKELTAAGQKSDDVKSLLAPAYALLADDHFWREHASGLAMFAAPSFFKYYRLPSSVEELSVVSDRFHVRPLVQILSNNGRFLVLALSLNNIRLLDAGQFDVHEIQLEDAPDDLKDSLPGEHHERQLQFHSEGSKIMGKSGTVFYGAGSVDTEEKINITRYFRQVDKALHKWLNGRTEHMVLAGVDHLLPLYHEVNKYPRLLQKGVTGSPDLISSEALRDKAWAIVEPHLHEHRDRAATAFKELGGGTKTTSEVVEAVIAAMQGRVESLFVRSDLQIWGSVDAATGTVELHPTKQKNDHDLLDYATIQTILKNGAVYVVDAAGMPGDGPVAAVYRF